MSVDEELRRGLAEAALSVEPDVEAHLSATLERAADRRVTRRAAVALAAAVVVVAGAVGLWRSDGGGLPRLAPPAGSQRVPDGTWIRDIRPSDLPTSPALDPQFLSSNGLADGVGRFLLQVSGNSFEVLVRMDDGSYAQGDRGVTRYDPDTGRWVLLSNNADGSASLAFDVDGNRLLTSDLQSSDRAPTSDERFTLQGIWTRSTP